MTYFRFLWAVLRHKWYVFVECCALGIPWLGLIHDASKFLPSEFIPYTRYFYGNEADKQIVEPLFDVAWLHHQHRNKHHWQRWLLTMDSARGSDKLSALPMPERYQREMLADWRGAGRAYGNADTAGWYRENRGQMMLHPDTRAWIEAHL